MITDTPAQFIKWLAQTVHQAYHTEHGGTWEECPKDICSSVKRWAEQGTTPEGTYEVVDLCVLPFKQEKGNTNKIKYCLKNFERELKAGRKIKHIQFQKLDQEIDTFLVMCVFETNSTIETALELMSE